MLYVVIVLEAVQQLAQLCHILLALQRDGVLRNHLDFSLCELKACFGQCIADSREIFRSSVDLEAVLISLEVIGTGIENRHHGFVLIQIAALDNQNALLLELPRYTAGIAETCAVLVEVVAHISNGTVTVVGQGLADNSDAGRTVALVRVGFVRNIALVALVKHALDVVVRDVVCLCFCDAVAQLCIVVRVVGAAFLDCYSHLTANLGKDCCFLCIVCALALCDIIPFRMSRHWMIPPYNRKIMLILLKIPLCTTPNYNIGTDNWQLYIFTIHGHTKGKRKRGDTEMCHNNSSNSGKQKNSAQSQNPQSSTQQAKNQKNSRNKNNPSFS